MLYTERSRIPQGLKRESERVSEIERDKEIKRETKGEGHIERDGDRERETEAALKYLIFAHIYLRTTLFLTLVMIGGGALCARHFLFIFLLEISPLY